MSLSSGRARAGPKRGGAASAALPALPASAATDASASFCSAHAAASAATAAAEAFAAALTAAASSSSHLANARISADDRCPPALRRFSSFSSCASSSMTCFRSRDSVSRPLM